MCMSEPLFLKFGAKIVLFLYQYKMFYAKKSKKMHFRPNKLFNDN